MKHPGTSRRFIMILAILPLVLGSCRSNQPPETKTAPPIQTQTEPDSKVVAPRPLFAGRIDNVSLYPVPNHPEDLALSLVVSARNVGSPSIVQGWNLEINSASRRVPTVLEPVHVSGLVEMPGSNNLKVDLAKEDLALKTAQAPIAKGPPVNGVLTFVLSKTSENELENNNTSLIVHFKDSQGNTYQTPKAVIGKKAKRSGDNPPPGQK